MEQLDIYFIKMEKQWVLHKVLFLFVSYISSGNVTITLFHPTDQLLLKLNWKCKEPVKLPSQKVANTVQTLAVSECRAHEENSKNKRTHLSWGKNTESMHHFKDKTGSTLNTTYQILILWQFAVHWYIFSLTS